MYVKIIVLDSIHLKGKIKRYGNEMTSILFIKELFQKAFTKGCMVGHTVTLRYNLIVEIGTHEKETYM